MAAILDGVINAVQGQVAAAANRTIRSGLTKVAGNLLGINTQFSGPQLGEAKPRAERFKPKNKYTSEHLMYPLNVQEDTQQGHYILFNIYVTDEAALERRKFIMDAWRAASRMLAKTIKRSSMFLGPGSIEETEERAVAEQLIDNYVPPKDGVNVIETRYGSCLLYTSPSPRDRG